MTGEDIKWWHWLIGAAIALLSAIFGGGMASQRFVDGIQSRLLNLEKQLNGFYKGGEIKFMTIDDFRRDQEICQVHMIALITDMKESNRQVKESLDKLTQTLLSKVK